MQFVFPFLVFFVLLFAGTFNTEPLLVLGRGGKDPNTGPEEEQNTDEWKYAQAEGIYRRQGESNITQIDWKTYLQILQGLQSNSVYIYSEPTADYVMDEDNME